MSRERLVDISERWFRLLQRLYPPDFSDNLGDAVVETYRDRARDALARGGLLRLAALWLRALVDSIRNGAGERAHPAASWRRSGNWGRDVELATRRLLRAPALVLAVVGTLGLGLGLFGVVYTVVQKVLIEPLPYQHPGDLYFVWRDYRAFFDLSRGWLGGTDVAELQKADDTIEGASGLLRQLSTFAPREGADAIEISVIAASPNLFDLLGVQPVLGRGFRPEETGPKRPPVIVLTHELWNRVGADRNILGTDVRLNGEPYTVIGVLPPAFGFVRHASLGPPQRADAYTTLNVNLASTNPGAGSYAGLIRARHGTSPQAVAAAVDRVGRLVDARDFKSRGLKLYPVGVKPDLVSGIRPALLVLGFAGALLVLVLVVNLTSVLIARAAQRDHEFAVSRALGANSAAVVRATLLEGALLGCAGGTLATIAAIWGTRALIALAPLDLPRREAVAVDWRIGAVVVALGTLLGLLAAVAPATWAARSSLASLLASSAVRGGGGRGRLRRAMVVAQVALSLMLLSTGALVVRSFDRLLRADPGFAPEGLITVRVPMPAQLIPKSEDATALQDRVERALAAIPGTNAVSAASAMPLTAAAGQNTITIPGAPGNTGNAERDAPLIDVIGTRAGYVELMGMRMVEGRTFEARRGTEREVLIDRRLARQFFPSTSAVGAKIPFGNDNKSVTVVGVVEQARLYDVHQDGRPQMYLRAEDFQYRTLIFVLRTQRDLRTLVADIRSAIRGVDPRLAVADVRTMDTVVGDALRRPRISAVLISGFAIGALLLAAMGLFGIVSGSVTRRRHELALRLAVGADHGRLVRLVLGEGAMLVGLGMLIGAPGIYVAGTLLRGVLVGVSPLDPLTLGSVALGLLAVTLVACYLPARRVLRIDPALSLRQE
jgi:putative ABC transport system permease protein